MGIFDSENEVMDQEFDQIELKNKKKKYQQIVIQTKQYFENLSSMNVKYFDIGDGLYVINK